MYNTIAEVIIRWPRGVIAVMILLLLASAFFATTIYQQTITEEYLDMDADDGIRYTMYNERLANDAFVLVIQTAEPTEQTLLHALLILDREFSELDYITGTTSVATVIRDAAGGVLPHNQEVIDTAITLIPEESRSMLIPDRQMTLAIISIEQGTPADVKYTLIEPVKTILANADLPPGVSIELTGTIPYNAEFVEAGSSSAIILILGAFVLMFIVIRLLFSSMRYWFMPIILLMVGLIYCFGVMGLLKVPFNDGATAAFPVLLGLGIDYAVQYHSRFDEERRNHSIDDAIRNTVRNTGPAVLLAMFATSMGFIAIFIVPVPMMKTFAAVSLIGVSCCYLASLFGFHALMKIIGYEPKPAEGALTAMMAGYGRLLEKVVRVVMVVAVPILIISLTIGISGLLIDSTIPIDTDTSKMGPPTLPAQLTINKVQNTGTSLTPFPLYIIGSDVTDLTVISWIDRFGSYEELQYQEITSHSSIATLIREYNRGDLPTTQGELETILGLIPQEKLNPYLFGRTESAISFQTASISMDQQKTLMTAVWDDIRWMSPPPGIELYPTGDFYLYTSLMQKIESHKDLMTLLGFILIFFYLLFAYRRSVAVTPVFPIVCIVGWNAAAISALGLHYNPISACLGSMTIGIAAQYTILIMERYMEEVKGGLIGSDAIISAVRKIGTSVTVSGLVTASGFSALMLSNFPLISSFGLLSVMTVIFSLIGAVTVMPAILCIYEKIQSRTIGRFSDRGAGSSV